MGDERRALPDTRDAEQSLIAVLAGIAATSGEHTGILRSLDKKVTEGFDGLHASVAGLTNRMEKVERAQAEPDPLKHLSPVQLADTTTHIKDTESHVSEQDRAALDWVKDRDKRRKSQIKTAGGVFGSLAGFLSGVWALASHWPKHWPL